MYNVRDHKTINMFDPFPQFGPKRRSILAGSWAQFFRDEILPILPVHVLRNHYHDIMGRPSKELHTMLGVMLLQQMFDLPDEEVSCQVAFNLQWHYALDIRGNADDVTFICSKTIFNMRELLVDHDLAQAIFAPIADHIANLFELDTSKQRLDSMHFQSNMRHLGRVGLFSRVIETFLKNLKRHHKALFDAFDEGIITRYLPKHRGESTFAMVKPSAAAKTLEIMAQDLFTLVERFHESEAISAMNSYQLLVRLLKEQCVVEPVAEARSRITVKPNKEVPTDSLQSPVDPDAGYSSHKGKGYQAQIMETYDETVKLDDDCKQMSLITYVDIEPAHKSDAHALLPAIEDTLSRELGPSEVLADSAYGGDGNLQAAAEIGVDIVAPTKGNPKTENKIALHEFKLNKAGKILSCPEGHVPMVRLKKQRYLAAFTPETCRKCPQIVKCPVKLGQSKCSLGYSQKVGRIAARRAVEKTREFREKYRHRAGIEGTNSLIARLTGIKRLRVRGIKAVKFAAILKIAGINILRASAFNMLPKKSKMGNNASVLPFLKSIYCPVAVFKELYRQITRLLREFSTMTRLTMITT